MKPLLFSHQAGYIYGGEIVTLAFLRELRARGVGAGFASPPGPYHERARAVAPVHEMPSRQFSRSLPQLPGIAASLARTARELRGLASRQGFDLLHATSLKAMAFAWSAASPSLPVIWHHHDILPPGVANSLWLRGLALRAARILVPSGATRDGLLQAGVDRSKVHVLRNGFPLGEWQARPPRLAGSPARVGVVGEISSRKGTDRIARILESLPSGSAVEVLVVGEGLSDPAFAAAARARLEPMGVRFLGRREDMKNLYQELDVLLVPSRQDPLPTVIVEAGLSGVPVVGARAGGIPEMIVEGSNGYLFDTEEEAASAIARALGEWPGLAAGARAVAEERYDLSRLTDELLAHYEAVLAGGRRG